MTEAARREGGAARGPAPGPTVEEDEEEEEGAPLEVKEWGMVVKEVLRGLDAEKRVETRYGAR